MYRYLLLLFYFQILSSLLFSQKVEWAKSEPHAGHVVQKYCIAHDYEENAIVAGRGYFGDIYLIKYNTKGIKLWEKNYEKDRSIGSLCIDKGNNILLSISQCESCTLNTSYKGTVLVKYAPDGNVIWEKRGLILSQCINSNNTIFVSAGFVDSVKLPPNIFLKTIQSNYSTFIGQMNQDGEFKWAIPDEGGSVNAVHFANDNTFYLNGYIFNSVTLGKGAKQVTLYEKDGFEYQANYSSTGELQWVKQLNTNLSCADVSGNYYAFERKNDYLEIGKYNSLGVCLWKKNKIKSYLDRAQLTSDKFGNLFFSGWFSKYLSIGDTTINGQENYNQLLLAKFDSSANLKWVITSTGPGVAGSKAISVDDNHNIYITGDMNGEVKFGGITLNEPNGGIFTLKIKDLDTPDQIITKVPGLNKSNKISIYPNPNQGTFRVEIPNSEFSIQHLLVRDVLGKIVYQFEHSIENSFFQNSYTIDLADKAKGIYFVEIETEKERIVRKVVLE